MGEKRELICPNCDYSILTSGGPDCGFFAYTNTFVCLDCKTLVDLAVYISKKKLYLRDKDPILPTHPLTNECPNCKGNDIAVWNAEKKECPKCGTHLIIKPHGAWVLWD